MLVKLALIFMTIANVLALNTFDIQRGKDDPDIFLIPNATCIKQLSSVREKCELFNGTSLANRCTCRCPQSRPTFGLLNGTWKCLGNNELRLSTNCKLLRPSSHNIGSKVPVIIDGFIVTLQTNSCSVPSSLRQNEEGTWENSDPNLFKLVWTKNETRHKLHVAAGYIKKLQGFVIKLGIECESNNKTITSCMLVKLPGKTSYVVSFAIPTTSSPFSSRPPIKSTTNAPGDDVGAIVGGVIGGLLGLLIIIAVICIAIRIKCPPGNSFGQATSNTETYSSAKLEEGLQQRRESVNEDDYTNPVPEPHIGGSTYGLVSAPRYSKQARTNATNGLGNSGLENEEQQYDLPSMRDSNYERMNSNPEETVQSGDYTIVTPSSGSNNKAGHTSLNNGDQTGEDYEIMGNGKKGKDVNANKCEPPKNIDVQEQPSYGNIGVGHKLDQEEHLYGNINVLPAMVNPQSIDKQAPVHHDNNSDGLLYATDDSAGQSEREASSHNNDENIPGNEDDAYVNANVDGRNGDVCTDIDIRENPAYVNLPQFKGNNDKNIDVFQGPPPPPRSTAGSLPSTEEGDVFAYGESEPEPVPPPRSSSLKEDPSSKIPTIGEKEARDVYPEVEPAPPPRSSSLPEDPSSVRLTTPRDQNASIDATRDKHGGAHPVYVNTSPLPKPKEK